jgi:hypothetical protein
LNYEKGERRSKKKRRKRKNDIHRYSYAVKWGRFKELKAKANDIGCSINSLIDIALERFLNPPLIQTQTGYIPQPVQRPPAVGLPPSRKKGEKDPLVAEVEKHPMFIRQKKRYG